MWHLPNHDLTGPGLTLSDLHNTTHFDAATSRSKVVVDPLIPTNLTCRGKIRPLNIFLDFINGDVGVIDSCTDTIDHLSHIMGRNISSHSDRDSSSTIHQQIGDCRRKHDRLLTIFVVSRLMIYRLLFEISHHC